MLEIKSSVTITYIILESIIIINTLSSFIVVLVFCRENKDTKEILVFKVYLERQGQLVQRVTKEDKDNKV